MTLKGEPFVQMVHRVHGQLQFQPLLLILVALSLQQHPPLWWAQQMSPSVGQWSVGLDGILFVSNLLAPQLGAMEERPLGSSTSKSYTGLTAGTTYDFEARTHCPNGTTSSWGAIVFTTNSPSGCELPPVLNNPATTTSSSIQISWAAVTGAGWYSFQYKESTSSTWMNGGTASGSSTSKLYIGLNANTSYDFRARTYCPNGTVSTYGSIEQFTTSGASALVLLNDNKSSQIVDKSGNSESKQIFVYPNPTKDWIYIEFFQTIETANRTIEIIDNSGRIVREINFSGPEGWTTVQINIQELKNGLYFIKFKETETSTYKVEKN